MQRQNKIIIVLLIISLVFNVYTISSIHNLRERIANDFKYYLETTVGEEVDEINDTVNQIKQEQQWLSKVDIKDGGIVDGIQFVKFSWQIKDYVSGSAVRFYYRKSGEDKFQQRIATAQTVGSFEAELEINKEDQPQWIVSYQYNDEDYKILKKEDKSPYLFEYYVVLDDGSRILSSDAKTINLKKIIQSYAFIEAEVLLNKEKIPSVIEFTCGENKIQPEKIILEVYNNNKVTETELKIETKGIAEWKSKDSSFDKLIARAQYKDGETFKKEIWNKNNSKI